MILLVTSFLAGILTILSPCVLPMLPLIIGSGSTGSKWKPLVINISLVVSVVLFTLLLKATTALLGIDPIVWKLLSGVLVLGLGLTYLFPHAWDWIMVKAGFSSSSQQVFDNASRKEGFSGAVITGFALGPVFTSCSPTYTLILATVLPASFGEGIVYLLAYAVGLAAVLYGVTIFGRPLVNKLGWFADPDGIARKLLGGLFLIIGLAVIGGYDKVLETWLLDGRWIDIVGIEEGLQRFLGVS